MNYTGVVKEAECPICLYENLKENNFVQTKCGHKFCKKCTTKWLKIQNNCPMCREDIKIVKLTPKKSWFNYLCR